ncbi:phosphatidylethanolamine-binding protein [Podospora didyma]|uniref:Phosphatidylethanolamine-binding protein n=1 Tax=Podospora didyma TaxID=330526 RepID=A0AAE0NUV8_9PEZI|nr:phosphatidylethanolamine-binding protein [Podospora didyma]
MLSHYSSAGLLALALAAAAPAMAADNATSLSTLEFKNRFRASGIVPEILPAALDPSVSFYASYVRTGHGNELILPGASLTVSEADLPFEFSVENLNNGTNVTANSRFLIYLLDADAPSRNNPTARNLRHYLAGNYTASGTTSQVLSTAQRLTIPTGQFRPFTSFIKPAPTANTGVHRYIFALYTQPARYNNAGFESAGQEASIENWNLTQWRTQLGLGPAIGATYFTIDTGANGGQGTSGNVPAGNGAAGVAVPVCMAALAAVLGFAALL